MTPAVIWITDDHAPFRRTLAKVLNSADGLQCAAQFDSSETLLKALEDAPRPDLLLLDVGLPGMSGLDAMRLIKERAPQTLIIVLTAFEDDENIFQAVCAGAAGYLLKTSTAAEIIQAVRDALKGGSPMNPRIARRVLEMFSKLAPKHSDYGLSEREKEILQLMVNGLIKKEIADRLTLSIHTVDTYLRRIYEKLEVHTRTGAVAKALKEGLV